MTDYDLGDPQRIDRMFRLGQFLEIVAESHHLGTMPDNELERRLMDSTTWQGPPRANSS